MPVASNSRQTGTPSASPAAAMTAASVTKNGSGLQSLNSDAIMRSTFAPSENVSSLDTDPTGRSRYSTLTCSMRHRLSTAWMDSSVSISNPPDSTGRVFANSRDMAREPVMTSAQSNP